MNNPTERVDRIKKNDERSKKVKLPLKGTLNHKIARRETTVISINPTMAKGMVFPSILFMPLFWLFLEPAPIVHLGGYTHLQVF